MNQIADKAWYHGISEAKSLPLRCPFATVDRCPRYYQSLSLLSETGATAIEPEEDSRLSDAAVRPLQIEGRAVSRTDQPGSDQLS